MESTLAMTLPFANEIAGVLTASGLSMFANLYVPVASTSVQMLSKLLIDFVALSGIMLNTVRATLEGGKVAGLVKGVGVLLIAFVVPNLFLHAAMEATCGGCGPGAKILVGVALVAGLTGLEVALDRFVVKRLSRRHMA